MPWNWRLAIGIESRTQVVAVGAGKGGVGKSTVALGLAMALTRRNLSVGILDADVFGPNIPAMIGQVRRKPAEHWTLAVAGSPRPIPPMMLSGLAVMSVGFFFGEDQAVTWDGALVRHLVSQLVYDVEWMGVDILLVDLPPGTGEIVQAVMDCVPISAAILVVTPADTAHLDARKALSMFNMAGVPVLGAIENMAKLDCPHCGSEIALFGPPPSGRSIWTQGVAQLGRLPMLVTERISDAGAFRSLQRIADSEFQRVLDDIAQRAFRVEPT